MRKVPNMENDATLLTAREAAEHLGVSVQTISRWAMSDKLPPAKKLPGIRGAYLFAAEDVQRVGASS